MRNEQAHGALLEWRFGDDTAYDSAAKLRAQVYSSSRERTLVSHTFDESWSRAWWRADIICTQAPVFQNEKPDLTVRMHVSTSTTGDSQSPLCATDAFIFALPRSPLVRQRNLD